MNFLDGVLCGLWIVIGLYSVRRRRWIDVVLALVIIVVYATRAALR